MSPMWGNSEQQVGGIESVGLFIDLDAFEV